MSCTLMQSVIDGLRGTDLNDILLPDPASACLAQALLVAAAGSAGLTEACLAQRDIREHTAMDLAFQNAHWFMIQLLVTAGDFPALLFT